MKMTPRMEPEYAWTLMPELARNWSAVSHRRFSSVPVTWSFSDGATQCMKLAHSMDSTQAKVKVGWRGIMLQFLNPIRERVTSGTDPVLLSDACPNCPRINLPQIFHR